MGRRKIEIQPITHERNRSVTFLKRKNGLFKKAYELGVLCSVDVAVIIFEERAGHHVKLYQYGSADIHDIVQRHLRHDGEKDTRGPQDFSGNPNTKLDDIGDGDDDDQDEDDDIQSRSVRKRGPDGKLKPTQDLVTGMDYGSGHRSLTIPQPLSMHGLAPPSGGGGSTLPISSMRDPTGNKRSRLGIPSSHSRSPSDDPTSAPGSYSYHPGQNPGPFGRPSNSPYQHHPSQHHSSQHHSSHQHHHQQHHHSQQGPPQQQQHHSNPQYQPFFSVSSHTSPPPSFIPLQSEFSRGSGSSSRGGGGGGGGGGGPGFGLPTRTNSSGSSYETGLYPNMIRPPGGPSQSSGPGGGSGGGGGGGGDLFAFLDADEQARHQSQSTQGSGFTMDWPVHSTGGGGGNATGNPGGGGGGGGSSAPSGPSTSSSSGGF